MFRFRSWSSVSHRALFWQHSVRVSDLGLGSTPLRITSVRALPDSAHEDALRTLSAEDREQLTGDHVNLEISFAYRGVPSGASTSSKAQNAQYVHVFSTCVYALS